MTYGRRREIQPSGRTRDMTLVQHDAEEHEQIDVDP
jgi:hypothetical protein